MSLYTKLFPQLGGGGGGSGGGGDAHWKAPVATAAALPLVGNSVSDARITDDTQAIYIWDGAAWVLDSVGPDNSSIARDGTRPPSADQPWNNKKITGIDEILFTGVFADFGGGLNLPNDKAVIWSNFAQNNAAALRFDANDHFLFSNFPVVLNQLRASGSGIAQTGFIRTAATAMIAWRDTLDTYDINFGVNGSNEFDAGTSININGHIQMLQQVTPSNPPLFFEKLFFKGDGFLYSVDNAGTVTQISGLPSGASFPLTSPNPNPATTGELRLCNAEQIGWRNAGNSANFTLGVDATDLLVSDAGMSLGTNNPAANPSLIINQDPSNNALAALIGAGFLPTAFALISDETTNADSPNTLAHAGTNAACGGFEWDVYVSRSTGGSPDFTSPAYLQNGDGIYNIFMAGDLAGTNLARIQVQASQNHNVTDRGTRMRFRTINDGATALVTTLELHGNQNLALSGSSSAPSWSFQGNTTFGMFKAAGGLGLASNVDAILIENGTGNVFLNQASSVNGCLILGSTDLATNSNISSNGGNQMFLRSPDVGSVIALQCNGATVFEALPDLAFANKGWATHRTNFTDSDYTALITDNIIAQDGVLTAARTVTLPDATTLEPGQEFLVKDESGTAGVVNTITVQGTGGQLIDGAASKVIVTGYGRVCVYTNGANFFIKYASL